jgi:hypothetical protein
MQGAATPAARLSPAKIQAYAARESGGGVRQRRTYRGNR